MSSSDGTVAGFRAGGVGEFDGVRQSIGIPRTVTNLYTDNPGDPSPNLTVTKGSGGIVPGSFLLKAVCNASKVDNEYWGYGLIQFEYSSDGTAGVSTVVVTGLWQNALAGSFAQAFFSTVPFCRCMCVGQTDGLATVATNISGSNPTFVEGPIPNGIGPDLQITIPTSAVAQNYSSTESIFLVIQPH